MQHSEGFLKLAEDTRRRIHEISVHEAHENLSSSGDEPARLIDVREDHEWAQGRAARAEHLGRGIIERLVPDKNARLILYCGGGYRSALACDNLQRMGYTNVHSMAGGWKAWKAAEFPVEGE